MKVGLISKALFPLSAGLLAWSMEAAELPNYSIKLNASGQNVRVSWPAALTNSEGAVYAPEFVLERSTDLANWSRVTGALRAAAPRSKPEFEFSFARGSTPVFFRVRADFDTQLLPAGLGGGEVLGYTGSVDDELKRIGSISVEDLVEAYPEPQWLSALSFDPTTARYWTNFAMNPADWNAALPTNSPDRRLHDFRLNATELEVFKTNGFVVSERLGARTFGDIYYKIWTDDLPVFVTTDSILQAWHRTFENMLIEIEELELSTALGEILTLRGRLQNVWSSAGSGPLRESILDMDYFLTVAVNLLQGSSNAPVMVTGQETEMRVQQTLADINAYQPKEVALFGTNYLRIVDFSQFQPRGHYTKTETLKRYFKAFTWCSQIDLRLATFAPNKEDDLRQLGSALVLRELMYFFEEELTEFLPVEECWFSYDNRKWQGMDQVLTGLFGPADSMTVPQLHNLFKTIKPVKFITSTNILADIQADLLSGELGTQMILNGVQFSPLDETQLRLPRSLTFLGQRFTQDSWAMGQVVFDRVLWPTNEPGVTLFNKVLRRKPSALDVAFTVFGNNAVVPDIAARIQATDGVPFRDGKPYQHNLAAVRNVIDAQDPAVWSGTLYDKWLSALRNLSNVPEGPGLAVPEVMKTRPWAMKDLNTQLAGWTQLRHDTLLYAKQSYTPPNLCEYPEGFVEPRPSFFRLMADLSSVMRVKTPEALASGTVWLPDPDGYSWGREVDISQAHQARSQFLQSFAGTMLRLEQMANKELAQQPFAPDEIAFIKTLAEGTTDYLGVRQYTGWYPKLFYKSVFHGAAFDERAGCDYPDGLIVDVHTDAPDPVVGDPGVVIHEAVGNVNMMLIAIDNGADRTVYAGPVLSHYEFEQPFPKRLTDEEWKAKITSPANTPPPPEWTRSYLVPK